MEDGVVRLSPFKNDTNFFGLSTALEAIRLFFSLMVEAPNKMRC